MRCKRRAARGLRGLICGSFYRLMAKQVMVDVDVCLAADRYIRELIRPICEKIECEDDRAIGRVLERYNAP